MLGMAADEEKTDNDESQRTSMAAEPTDELISTHYTGTLAMPRDRPPLPRSRAKHASPSQHCAARHCRSASLADPTAERNRRNAELAEFPPERKIKTPRPAPLVRRSHG
ncbi:hypothetical protein GCM10027563_15400 [Parasphingorhabdus pacifica]